MLLQAFHSLISTVSSSCTAFASEWNSLVTLNGKWERINSESISLATLLTNPFVAPALGVPSTPQTSDPETVFPFFNLQNRV